MPTGAGGMPARGGFPAEGRSRTGKLEEYGRTIFKAVTEHAKVTTPDLGHRNAGRTGLRHDPALLILRPEPGEVKDLRREMHDLKEALAEQVLENRLLKKSMIGDGGDGA